MGGHCSQKLCPGGDCTPLRGAADLRINTRSTTLSQRSAARGLVSQRSLFSRLRRRGCDSRRPGRHRLPGNEFSLAGIQSPLLTIGGVVPAGPPKWLPPPLPLTGSQATLQTYTDLRVAGPAETSPRAGSRHRAAG
jgi:hypothetical protein